MSCGLSHAEFWGLSLRELDRIVRVEKQRIKAQYEADVALVAVQTAELVNIVGSAASDRRHPWKRVTPKQYFDAWTGHSGPSLPKMTMEEYRRREAEVEAVVMERVRRQQARRAKAEQESGPQQSAPLTQPSD